MWSQSNKYNEKNLAEYETKKQKLNKKLEKWSKMLHYPLSLELKKHTPVEETEQYIKNS
jgi:hypothetical protein